LTVSRAFARASSIEIVPALPMVIQCCLRSAPMVTAANVFTPFGVTLM
jgi:hypothetical protein